MDHEVENSLVKTIAEPNLDVASDLLELGIEELANSDAVTKLPVVGGIVAFGKTALAVRDWIFVKQILEFLRGVDTVDSKKRQEWLAKLDDDNFKARVGEDVLGIVDRLGDKNKNFIAGKLFALYIEGRIDYRRFVSICEKLERLFTSDLRGLETSLPNSDDDKERFRSMGLYVVYYPGVKNPEAIAFSSNRELIPNQDCDLLVEVIRQK